MSRFARLCGRRRGPDSRRQGLLASPAPRTGRPAAALLAAADRFPAAAQCTARAPAARYPTDPAVTDPAAAALAVAARASAGRLVVASLVLAPRAPQTLLIPQAGAGAARQRPGLLRERAAGEPGRKPAPAARRHRARLAAGSRSPRRGGGGMRR